MVELGKKVVSRPMLTCRGRLRSLVSQSRGRATNSLLGRDFMFSEISVRFYISLYNVAIWCNQILLQLFAMLLFLYKKIQRMFTFNGDV